MKFNLNTVMWPFNTTITSYENLDPCLKDASIKCTMLVVAMTISRQQFLTDVRQSCI